MPKTKFPSLDNIKNASTKFLVEIKSWVCGKTSHQTRDVFIPLDIAETLLPIKVSYENGSKDGDPVIIECGNTKTTAEIENGGIRLRTAIETISKESWTIGEDYTKKQIRNCLGIKNG